MPTLEWIGKSKVINHHQVIYALSDFLIMVFVMVSEAIT